jgi:GT2 family glycosyltransferase
LNGIKENPSIDVCSTDEVLVDQSTGRTALLNYGPYRSDFYRRLLVTGNCLSPSATLVRRAFINSHNILFRENAEFATAEDYDLWMLLAQAGAKFHFIHSVQGEYLVHAANSSGQVVRHQQNIVNVIKDHVYNLQSFQADKDRLWRRINSRLLFASALGLIAGRRFVPGIRELILAFRSSTAGALGFILSRAEHRIGNSILRWMN